MLKKCHAGIEMMDGILMDSGDSRTRFESFESFTDYSSVTNRVLQVANGQTIPIL